ncbi:MAG: aminoglycoside phosphotransferase family protein, partial [bacterium]|nr:aminoglycoside phosphotransferase family protein [bacterium]
MIAGKVTEFIRVGDEVLRPAGASTESMRQLLAHLEERGFRGAPQVVGSEPDGAVRLTWVEGWVPDEAEGWKLDAEALESVG